MRARHLLLAAAAVMQICIFSGNPPPANAAVIADLGVNPNSGQGDFRRGTIAAGPFADQFTFQLVGGPQFITVGSATNTFANGSGSTDYITGFTAFIRQQLGAAPAPGDPIVLGPQAASPCADAPTTCQAVGGQALLNPGSYYLEFTGSSGGTSGYGGNLSTFAVPAPVMGGLPLLLPLAAFLAWRRRRSSSPTRISAPQ